MRGGAQPIISQEQKTGQRFDPEQSPALVVAPKEKRKRTPEAPEPAALQQHVENLLNRRFDLVKKINAGALRVPAQDEMLLMQARVKMKRIEDMLQDQENTPLNENQLLALQEQLDEIEELVTNTEALQRDRAQDSRSPETMEMLNHYREQMNEFERLQRTALQTYLSLSEAPQAVQLALTKAERTLTRLEETVDFGIPYEDVMNNQLDRADERLHQLEEVLEQDAEQVLMHAKERYAALRDGILSERARAEVDGLLALANSAYIEGTYSEVHEYSTAAEDVLAEHTTVLPEQIIDASVPPADEQKAITSPPPRREQQEHAEFDLTRHMLKEATSQLNMLLQEPSPITGENRELLKNWQTYLETQAQLDPAEQDLDLRRRISELQSWMTAEGGQEQAPREQLDFLMSTNNFRLSPESLSLIRLLNMAANANNPAEQIAQVWQKFEGQEDDLEPAFYLALHQIDLDTRLIGEDLPWPPELRNRFRHMNEKYEVTSRIEAEQRISALKKRMDAAKNRVKANASTALGKHIRQELSEYKRARKANDWPALLQSVTSIDFHLDELLAREEKVRERGEDALVAFEGLRSRIAADRAADTASQLEAAGEYMADTLTQPTLSYEAIDAAISTYEQARTQWEQDKARREAREKRDAVHKERQRARLRDVRAGLQESVRALAKDKREPALAVLRAVDILRDTRRGNGTLAEIDAALDHVEITFALWKRDQRHRETLGNLYRTVLQEIHTYNRDRAAELDAAPERQSLLESLHNYNRLQQDSAVETSTLKEQLDVVRALWTEVKTDIEGKRAEQARQKELQREGKNQPKVDALKAYQDIQTIFEETRASDITPNMRALRANLYKAYRQENHEEVIQLAEQIREEARTPAHRRTERVVRIAEDEPQDPEARFEALRSRWQELYGVNVMNDETLRDAISDLIKARNVGDESEMKRLMSEIETGLDARVAAGKVPEKKLQPGAITRPRPPKQQKSGLLNRLFG